MNELSAIILQKAKQRETLVFPSEVACDHYKRKILQYQNLSILSDKQFISWDEFKAETFQIPDKTKLIDDAERLLFIHTIIEEHQASSLFSVILPADREQATVFTKSLLKILAVLPRIVEASCLESRKSRDLRRLFNHYSEFLRLNGLFDPEFEISRIITHKKRYTIFFSEVIDDFPRYAHELAKIEHVEVVPLRSYEQNTPHRITIFENSIHETTWLVTKIRQLLQSGTAPEDIIITVCDLDEVAAQIESQFHLNGIPIRIRSGKPVSSYVVTGLFEDIASCYVNQFSFESLRRLFNNRALPWKHPETLTSLLRFGIKYKCSKNFTKTRTDTWVTALNKAITSDREYQDTGSELLDVYKKLTARIKNINEARSFPILRDAITAFINEFFDTTAWDHEQLNMIQFSRNVLNELCISANMLTGCSCNRAYPVFLEYLDDKIYVPRTSERAISVYPYRVSAGIFPRYHFIINTSQHGVRHTAGDVPFLDEYEKSRIDATRTGLFLDYTDDFLTLYSSSGENVFFTHAQESPSRTNIIPARFLNAGSAERFSDTGFLRNHDPLICEEDVWFGKTPHLPHELSHVQKTGFAFARTTGLAPKRIDYTRDRISREDCDMHILPVLENNGTMPLSATKLELFAFCPFRYLLEKVLHCTDVEREIILDDPRDKGSMYHAVFDRFYGNVRQRENPTLGADRESVQAMMDDAISHVMAYHERHRVVPLKPVWHAWETDIRAWGDVFAGIEAENFADWSVLYLEEKLTVPIDPDKIILEGTIDRVSCRGESLAVVDYKKKSGVPRSDIFSENPTSFQIPVYVHLAETVTGKLTELAGYYLVEQGKYVWVYSSDDDDRDGKLAPCIGKMLDAARDIARLIRSGMFGVPSSPQKKECESCSYRSVCRSRFLIA